MASLFGALTTAVSGLSAQSAAFSNISDNVANSQTTGFKRTDTSFGDYLTTSSSVTNDSGFVTGRPDYRNDVQGTVSASDNTTALAISGSGFFQVSRASTNSAGAEQLGTRVDYTRDGNFSVDKNGYLVNDAGEALNGWLVDGTTGLLDKGSLQPIKINQSAFAPIATSNVVLSANLPATPAANTPVTSQVNVYDAKGTLHTVALSWTQSTTTADDWTVAVTAADSNPPTLGTADVTFGATASGNPVAAGTIGGITNANGKLTGSTYSANGSATLSMALDFGEGPQNISLNLGNYGSSTGLTQFAGTSYTLNNITQDGVPPGSFSGVSTLNDGSIVVNFDNGQARTVAQAPVVQFVSPNALQKQDGQVYTATLGSGSPLVKAASTGGAGQLVTNAVEGSNTDIAAEFSKLIVAQRAYSANTKVVTTADDMLQQTIDMKR